ncbi:MAG: 30S ribosomal protein S8 [bacterium]|nr:30S ribosomal protein S8 [bacterium]
MDPIADLLTCIRNANAVGNPVAVIPFSKLSFAIAEVLAHKKWIDGVTKPGKKAKKTLEIALKYSGKTPAITGVRRISKLGKRVYKGWKTLRPVRQGYGMALISTPQGLLTDTEARKLKVGGEVLLEIW